MGGTIGVESKPGRGSTFWFLLPIGQAEAEPEPPAREAAAPERQSAKAAETAEPLPCNGHVLIVDDNPVNQIVAGRAVRSLGYSVEIVAGGQAALDALLRAHFDVMLLDCQMPEMDGYATAAEVRRREDSATLQLHRTPIVAMTANAIEGELERCLAAGMDDYVAKPFRMAKLESTLERWVHRPKAPDGETVMCGLANSGGASPKPPDLPNGSLPTRPPTPHLPA
jgi:CheY-like chemotaxis protein